MLLSWPHHKDELETLCTNCYYFHFHNILPELKSIPRAIDTENQLFTHSSILRAYKHVPTHSFFPA